MGLEVFSQMAVVVEDLLTTSVKVSVAHSTRKAARLAMNGLSMPLQRFPASGALGAKVAHGPLAVALGRRRNRRGWRRRRREVNRELKHEDFSRRRRGEIREGLVLTSSFSRQI